MSDECYEVEYELTEAQVSRAARAFWWRKQGWPTVIVTCTVLGLSGLIVLVGDYPLALLVCLLTIGG